MAVTFAVQAGLWFCFHPCFCLVVVVILLSPVLDLDARRIQDLPLFGISMVAAGSGLLPSRRHITRDPLRVIHRCLHRGIAKSCGCDSEWRSALGRAKMGDSSRGPILGTRGNLYLQIFQHRNPVKIGRAPRKAGMYVFLVCINKLGKLCLGNIIQVRVDRHQGDEAAGG